MVTPFPPRSTRNTCILDGPGPHKRIPCLNIAVVSWFFHHLTPKSDQAWPYYSTYHSLYYYRYQPTKIHTHIPYSVFYSIIHIELFPLLSSLINFTTLLYNLTLLPISSFIFISFHKLCVSYVLLLLAIAINQVIRFDESLLFIPLYHHNHCLPKTLKTYTSEKRRSFLLYSTLPPLDIYAPPSIHDTIHIFRN